jgi:hypothetical protein
MKVSLLKEHGGILLKENISDIEGINAMAGGTILPVAEYEELRARAARLAADL